MDVKNNFILYVGYIDRVDQYFCNSESECYSLVQKLKCINYKIYKAQDCINNYYSSCLEWNFENKDIKINIEKLKEIKRSQYRELRIELFDKLDVKYIRAIEENNQTKIQKIVELKNLLRDVTEIDLPNTSVELFNYIPECFADVVLYLSQS